MLVLTPFTLLFGLLIGSFLNALIWRTHEGRSINEKHSVCPHCQHPLTWYDLFPLFSFLFLRGKCRYCRQPISWQYPLVELVTGLLFGATTWRMLQVMGSEPTWWWVAALAVSLVSLSLLIALFVYDWHWGILPNQWTLGGAGLVLGATITAWFLHYPLLWQPGAVLPTPDPLLPTLLSALFAAIFFLTIVYGSEKLLKRPGMGMGDVKLALFMGLLLGFPGIVIALYLAFILGAVLSLLLLASKQKRFGQTIPFGPFLVVGTILTYWLAPTLVAWYTTLL